MPLDNLSIASSHRCQHNLELLGLAMQSAHVTRLCVAREVLTGTSPFSITYTLQILREVDFRHLHTKHSCWLYWHLLGEIEAAHQSRVHSSPSHPSDKGFDDFPDTSTTDLSNFPTLLSSPPTPSLHHSFRFPFLPCHPAAAPGHSSSVLFIPPGQSSLQMLTLRAFLCGLVEKVMRLHPSLLQSGGTRSSSGSEVQPCWTGSTRLRVIPLALGFAFQGGGYDVFLNTSGKLLFVLRAVVRNKLMKSHFITVHTRKVSLSQQSIGGWTAPLLPPASQTQSPALPQPLSKTTGTKQPAL